MQESLLTGWGKIFERARLTKEIEDRLNELDKGVSVEEILAGVEYHELESDEGKKTIASGLGFERLLVLIRYHRIFSSVKIYSSTSISELPEGRFLLTDGEFDPETRVIENGTYSAEFSHQDKISPDPEEPEKLKIRIKSNLTQKEVQELCTKVMGGSLDEQLEIVPPDEESFFL